MSSLSNYDIRDEIRAYWSERAATFDLSPGHEIFSEAERQAWQALILKHLGPGEGRRALDLASGTGVISHLMDDLGFQVTGLDWSEEMLALAREKAGKRGRSIRFLHGDAERCMEPDASYDVIICRHLVWTLIDPKACFVEWLRVLKPGGKVLVIDGDFVNVGRLETMLQVLGRLVARVRQSPSETTAQAEMKQRFNAILSQVHFSQGARANDVAALMAEAGFSSVAIDQDMKAVHREQAKHMGILRGLARQVQHRYAVVGTKPS
ncbi:class I SAM-dependent methyltransferase [Limoniibacter endophyticus]|uniref:Methyltransferase n=1 Tax=Limoniibacter endophyticus TaxID=1565040 RepID=A0A8J3DGW8_9HYPH|nr:class I SAM-dependent methyltransferase [Limoniibacter endophyticus]GHC65258.1 methyltransferase [Limoniibacter endophyticus]